MAVSLTPCPRPGHAGNRTRKRGRVVVAGEYQQRWERVAPDGSVHHFQVLEDTEHTGAASIHFPPPCPDHLDSRVLRHGTYGKGTKQLSGTAASQPSTSAPTRSRRRSHARRSSTGLRTVTSAKRSCLHTAAR